MAEAVLHEAERDDDKLTMAWALELLGGIFVHEGRLLDELDLLRRALTLTEQADDQQAIRTMRILVANRLQFAPIPSPEAEREVRRMLQHETEPAVRILLLTAAAVLAAHDLRIEEANSRLVDARAEGEALGQVMPFLAADWPSAVGMVGFAIGDPRMTEEALRPVLGILESAEDEWHLCPMRGMLARAIALQVDRLTPDREAEVKTLCEQAARTAQTFDPGTQALWRQPLALLASHRGQHDAAVRHAGEAAEIVRNSQTLDLEAEAYLDYATVLEAANRPDEARAAAEWAASRADLKASRAHRAQAGRILERLGAPP